MNEMCFHLKALCGWTNVRLNEREIIYLSVWLELL